MTDSRELPLEISVEDVAALRGSKASHFLLDCREEDEYAIAKIAGATLIPMSQLAERLEELEPHRDERLIVYCHHGSRSLQVARALRQRGYAKVQSMAGGIDVWSEQIDAGIPRY